MIYTRGTAVPLHHADTPTREFTVDSHVMYIIDDASEDDTKPNMFLQVPWMTLLCRSHSMAVSQQKIDLEPRHTHSNAAWPAR
jgi:hypothetical protein